MDPRIIAGSCAASWPDHGGPDGAWTVGMAFLVGAGGELLDARMLRGSGARELDHASLAALKSCSFTPGMVAGRPVEAWSEVNKKIVRASGRVQMVDAPSRDRHD